MSGREKRTARKIRFSLDALLSAALLIGVFFAVTSRSYTETGRFRRAERANLVGPSEIIDRLDLPEHWTEVGYDRLMIGDDGEEILFYPLRKKTELGTIYGDWPLFRREKTDGLLLTTLPSNGLSGYGARNTAVPLFLFVDDPRAVRAEVTLRLSDSIEIELAQGRGRDVPQVKRDGFAREHFFLFTIPVPENRWSKRWELLGELAEINSYVWTVTTEFPAIIRLYDISGALLETREYLIQSPGITGTVRE